MAQALVASSSSSFLLNASAAKTARPQVSACFLPRSRVSQIASSFKSGSPLVVRLASMRNFECRSAWVPIRCEQGAKESSGLDVWLGRLAMVGFATVITVEIVTGKGLLENFGFVTPFPSLALVVTSLIGILAAVFIFQSAARD
ncbi:stress enhanced protein 1, chloroplastic isoform X2 [Dendrobium catenatum]|uniref:Stress enhanced protein 1, chloroplastic n=1 Tax=Dendrobium catenatum TaxID=906689 RepID=A0A2I0VVA7_9ASPA|nr:stress enhanced protein 1, chloroplastic isoform X2 [Dendrobium catenatum]PKU67334.1 Stress enhanced protein 1, chloroplastic [Dendrobium catenatum]